MSHELGRIWDWLLENKKFRLPRKRTVPPPKQEELSHQIDDLTLLALEREAETAARFRERQRR
jgi:hypothetical protein